MADEYIGMLDILHKMKTRVRLQDTRDNLWIYVQYCLEITDVFKSDVVPCMKYVICMIR